MLNLLYNFLITKKDMSMKLLLVGVVAVATVFPLELVVMMRP